MVGCVSDIMRHQTKKIQIREDVMRTSNRHRKRIFLSSFGGPWVISGSRADCQNKMDGELALLVTVLRRIERRDGED